jgi:hypothetical protein
MADVFISYTRRDAKFVVALVRLLEAQGLSTWHDASVRGGADWRDAIVNAIAGARIVVLVYSRAAERSPEVAKELAVAANQKRRIIPIRVEEAVPSGAFLYEMARLNWVDCFPVTEARMESVTLAIAALVRGGIDAPAVESFERAVGARHLGQGRIARLSRNGLAVATAILAISTALFGSYDQATSFLAEQAQAGVPALDSILRGVAIVTFGAPLLLLESMRHPDRPWTWAIVPLALANCFVLLVCVRNVLDWARRRATLAWATRRTTGATP